MVDTVIQELFPTYLSLFVLLLNDKRASKSQCQIHLLPHIGIMASKKKKKINQKKSIWREKKISHSNVNIEKYRLNL